MTITAVPGDAPARPGRARAVVVAAAAVLATVAALALATKPGAPPRLVSTEATAETGPAEIVLTFSSRPDAATSHVAVRDADGMVINAGELSADGARLRQPVRAPGPGGYTVAFHVTFDDGAELSGSTASGTVAAPAAGEAVAGDHSHGVDPVGAVLLLLDAATVAVVGVLLMRRPRRPLSEKDTDGIKR
ncbi:copper resistance CopC family protein [Luedemannella helvata]|uniref:CopC domain-containing protein n=1 Tax=Luedemannella helvata TaxID=349315 RepID=A0ABN2KVG0_9ACTN